VLPGLIDSHIHAAEGALARGGCSLADKELSITDAGPIIKACFAKGAPPGLLVVTDVNPANFNQEDFFNPEVWDAPRRF